MTNTLTIGLIDSLLWERDYNCLFDTKVGAAIASHCVADGIPVPADEQFQEAEWFVPQGTAFEPPPSLNGMPAPALRVDLPNGQRFALIVGWGDVCGCETCSGAPSLRVVEVRP